MSNVYVDSYGTTIVGAYMKKVLSKSGKGKVISNPMKGKKGVC